MRLISLEPFITDLLSYQGLSAQLVGISHRCKAPQDAANLQLVTLEKEDRAINGDKLLRSDWLSRYPINLDLIKQCSPDCILAAIYPTGKESEISPEELVHYRQELSQKIGKEIKLISYAPRRLEQIYEGSAKIMRQLGAIQRGNDLGQRAKAQLMDYGDNFYERMKNKKVSFICSIEPLTLAGLWIPDMIQLLSGLSQLPAPALSNKVVTWEEILHFRPDVIVVAPIDATLNESLATFKKLEKLNDWEGLPAVKRGEVVFCDGLDHFYSPGPSIISSFGYLVSAMAGLDSGYITPRDSFYRLRWLEMQRHRF